MKKLLVSLFISILCFSGSISPLTATSRVSAQQKPIPPYAKWGTLALKETHKKYPRAKIIDYLHIGRTSGSQTSTEKFKLWLKDNNKEFGVFVNIEFNKETEKVVKITFQETSR
ncbi:YqzG/YhdC family protein [Bacillus sp. X1(2014)]|uniref:YqzG/YhdC family protein n=1 Tax=Bacillus sp. X1(2014) TaxID=1565991 RepID=UPI00119D45E5|nr:YqzG/YhdC family protein [Bacillus sp. X1(2014)]